MKPDDLKDLLDVVSKKIREATVNEFINLIYWKAVKHIKGKNKDECFIEISFEKLDEIAKEITERKIEDDYE